MKKSIKKVSGKNKSLLPPGLLEAIRHFDNEQEKKLAKRKEPGFTDQEVFLRKREQLYWFVNRILQLSNSPVILNEYDEYICFPVELIKEEKAELFLLKEEKIDETNFMIKPEEADHCQEMLKKIKKDLYKLKNITRIYNHFSWIEDYCDQNLYGYAFFIELQYKVIFEEYLNFMDRNEIEPVDNKEKKTINKIEILEDKTGRKRIKVYLNNDYQNPKEFSRNKSWGKMYELADIGFIDYNNIFYNYFNTGKNNPLYAKRCGFKTALIVKREDDLIVPNIEIKLITKNMLARLLKST